MNYKIMFVDEAVNLLEVLKWVFKDEPYDVLAFRQSDPVTLKAGREFHKIVTRFYSYQNVQSKSNA